MKKLFTLIALAITLITTAQAPQGFNYQATVRNSSGALITNQNVLFKFNIMLNSQTSLPVYSETHQAPTDDLGQVNLVIGTGTPTIGTFSSINWANGSYFLGIELNTGAGYVAMGTTQLLSVPFALYANSAGNSQSTTPNLGAVLAVNNSANNTKITNLANPSDAQDAVTKSYLETQIAQLQSQITALQNANIAPLPSVTIGTQIWSRTNLDVTTYRDGTPIPQVTDPTQWANLTTGAWCYYNNDPANNATYGKLYNWYAVAGIYDAASLNDPSLRKQLAPQGWHIPSDAEWTTLTTFLGGESVAGGKMKSTGTIQAGTGLWQSPNTSATNESGFTGLPAGFRFGLGTFGGIGLRGNWWSSSEYNTASAWARDLDYNLGSAGSSLASIVGIGSSVRCLRD
jgi:uncharacterized protein (TIGR02145 family)